MKVVLFYHSLVSDWNHGNAHFLRGIAAQLLDRGHDVGVYEPRDGWSRTNLVAECGLGAITRFRRAYPQLRSTVYDLDRFDVERALDGASLVIVHEWNDPELVRRIGKVRARTPRMRLLFHDTHHRLKTAPHQLRRYDLTEYDGVLAYGDVIRDLYLERELAEEAWTWHEAADVRVFHPRIGRERRGDVVWIGNWGDGERSAELRHFLCRPVRELGLSGSVFGVRYPQQARRELDESGLVYRGWIANYEVPAVFAEHAVTVHVPRRPYVRALPGIPTIRPFEAMACGIPLISTPWEDVDGLFRPGDDFLVVRDYREMKRALRDVLRDRALCRSLAQNGLRAIHERHTCAHRVDELFDICAQLRLSVLAPAVAKAGR